ncbi:MAG: hypothetical protein KDJ37_08775 [Hyphomicrobiaceae bacterium]|nr:hypothetical protein [Hyphomicrobiaceae bacterium]
MNKRFEVRLAVEPNEWKPIVARTAQEAAEAFVYGLEHSLQSWAIAQSRRSTLVVVREADDVIVSACYRVSGRLVPRYSAVLELPGAQLATSGA